MAIQSFAYDTKTLTAAAHGAWLAGISTRGVMRDYMNQLAVSQSGTPAMSVDVATGGAVCGLANTMAFVLNDALKTITIATADPTNPRWDLIVVERDANSGVRASDIKVVTGTPAGSPADPTLTQTETKYQMAIARVVVGAAVTTIVNANITDLRAFAQARAFEDELFAHKSADQTVNNSTTLVNDTHLVKAVEANSRYAVEGCFYFTEADNAPDFKFQTVLPASATFDGITDASGISAVTRNAFNEAAATAIGGTTGDNVIKWSGILIVAGTAGNFQIQWAQNTAGAFDTILKTGSWIRLKKLN